MKNILYAIILLSFATMQSCINDNEDPVAVSRFEGKILQPAVGGPSQPNQVWIDLSTGDMTTTARTKWDLGFYSGDSFKVVMNTSLLMAAGKIDGATDIDAVTESSVALLKKKVQVANFDTDNEQYIDNVRGEINGKTAIAEVSANDSDNGIYLLNLGKGIYNGTVPVGSTTYSGDPRGWKKIQVLRSGNGYKIKYANLNDTTHKELVVAKKPDYNFSFFSFETNSEVSVQPQKKNWDLSFTVFTNIIPGAGSYAYADFVTHNILGNVGAYQVNVPAAINASDYYNNFKAADIDISKLNFNDQRIIGSNWRNPVGTNGIEVYGDRFYIVRDSDGLYYKIKFNRMTNLEGVRGYPQFEYKPL